MRSYPIKSLLIFGISIVIILGVILSYHFYFQQEQMIGILKEQGKGLAQVWSSKISLKEVEEAINNPKREASIQKELTKNLDSLVNNNQNVRLAYILSPKLAPISLSENLYQYGLKLGVPFENAEEVVKEALKVGLEEKRVVTTEVYTDPVGTFMSVLQPIYNQDGEIIAFFGMDIDAKNIKEAENKLFISMISSLIIALSTILILEYIIFKKVPNISN